MNSMPPPETMKVLKPLARRYVEQLEHRLVDHFGVGRAGASGGVAVAIQSPTMASNSSVVMPAWVATTISSRPCSPAAASAFMSPSSTALKGCVVFHSGCSGAIALHPVEGEEELEVHRLLSPQRAVVVEDGDALGRGHEVRAAGIGDPRRRSRESTPWRHRRSTTAADRQSIRRPVGRRRRATQRDGEPECSDK